MRSYPLEYRIDPDHGSDGTIPSACCGRLKFIPMHNAYVKNAYTTTHHHAILDRLLSAPGAPFLSCPPHGETVRSTPGLAAVPGSSRWKV